ncbi:MAG TPA: 8-oxo-dGTP diphosphatase MutT [Rhodanobacteraceae bacterium]
MGSSESATEVAAGVLTDARGRVLLMQRLPGKHLAGLWEFPGGKLEPGETVGRALVRELREELGIEARAFAPLISLPWRYPEKSVRLHVLRVTAWEGDPHAREGHPLRWVPVEDMVPAQMPAADRPIVTALRLPAFYAITPAGLDACRALPHPDPLPTGERGKSREPAPGGSVVSPLPTGARKTGAKRLAAEEGRRSLLQLRTPGRDRDAMRATAVAMLEQTPDLKSRLLVNADVELARELGIGVHLRASQLRELDRRPLPGAQWVGASCHDADELERAATIGADFATLSPVRATASHPGASPLGWDRFAELVREARLPVYALGGIGPADLDRARAAGAQGVAGISAFM